MAITIDAVTLVSIFVQAVLYGLFVFLFAVSTVVLLRKKASGLNKPMLSASIIMFILGTIHLGVDLNRTMHAFLKEENTVQYLDEVNTILYSLKSTAYATQTLVGDGFALYRVYLVWNGDKRVIIPIGICFVASIGVGIGALQGFARVSSDAPVFIQELHDWIVSFFSLTLFTNFSCTSLIAARIWWIHRRVKGVVTGSSLVPAAVIIIESGAIYSACLVILLSLYLSGSFAQYIVLDAVTQVIGVVFSLIIVRVGLGLSAETTNAGTQSRLTFFHSDKSDHKRTEGNVYPLRRVGVSVTQSTVQHSTDDEEIYRYKADGTVAGDSVTQV